MTMTLKEVKKCGTCGKPHMSIPAESKQSFEDEPKYHSYVFNCDAKGCDSTLYTKVGNVIKAVQAQSEAA